MKVEYVQDLDDEDIRRVCADALADIYSKYAAAKDKKDARSMRYWVREFDAVSCFQRTSLGILFRKDDGMVWDMDGEFLHDVEQIEGYEKTLAELNGAEICPLCGSLLKLEESEL